MRITRHVLKCTHAYRQPISRTLLMPDQLIKARLLISKYRHIHNCLKKMVSSSWSMIWPSHSFLSFLARHLLKHYIVYRFIMVFSILSFFPTPSVDC